MNRPDTSLSKSSAALLGGILFALCAHLLFGGSARPLNLLLCFAASLPLLFMLLREGRVGIPGSWLLRLVFGLYLLAWLQLIPLPPAVWTGLPGRGLAAQALTITGQPLGWRPIALDPGAAATALISLAAPLILLTGLTRLNRQQLDYILRALVALAVATAVLGILQRVTGGLTPYDTEHAGYATGLFANRNHHAAFLSCAIALLPALNAHTSSRPNWLVLGAAATVLFTGVLATTSRAGIVLGTLSLVIALLLVVRPSGRAVLASGTILAAIGVVLLQVPVLEPVFDRFASLGEDQRLIMAEGSLAAAKEFFPWGSGWGSFVQVYMAFEDLDTMTGRYVVAAHNDYLQLIVEGGIFGLLVGLAGPLTLVGLAIANWRHGVTLPSAPFWLVSAILLTHSFVDFPLRTTALLAIFALAAAAQEILRSPLPARPSDA